MTIYGRNYFCISEGFMTDIRSANVRRLECVYSCGIKKYFSSRQAICASLTNKKFAKVSPLVSSNDVWIYRVMSTLCAEYFRMLK